MRLNLIVHESHLPLWEQKHWRYGIIMGGRGNGRSGTASRFSFTSLFDKEYTRGALMRAVREDIRASCWGDIIDRINEQEIAHEFRIVDNDMYIERGKNSLRAHGFKSSSGSLTARLKSLAKYNYVWIEEAEEIGEEEFMKLDDTLRTVEGRIRIVFTLNTPPKSHWILTKWFDLTEHEEARGFYVPTLKKEREKDTVFIGGTWRENEPNLDKHTIERYQEYKLTKPAYYWQVIEGLSPEEVRGKIYSGWQLIDEIPEDARLVRFGVDWGWYPDPTVIVAVYYYNGGYIIDELLYENYLQDEETARAIKDVNGWNNVIASCGADEPKSIEVLSKYGIRAEKGVSGPGAVDYRIKTVASKKIFVTRRSTKIWDSYENYRWAEDKDGNPKGEPDHFKSDGMDAVGYAVSSINPIENQKPHARRPTQRQNIAV